VAVAVERLHAGEPGRPPIPGRVALGVLPDLTTASVRAFVDTPVKPGSALWTDKFSSYGGLSWRGYPHAAIALNGDRDLTRRFFPWVHIVLSNLKRFLLGTHHKPQPKHLARLTCPPKTGPVEM
jgi:hypothetical protein